MKDGFVCIWQVGVVLMMLAVTGCSTAKYSRSVSPASYKSGVLQKAALEESSGLTRSSCSKDWFWTHNDSGDGPRLYMVDRYGADLGTFSILGARARDWEDITSAELDGKYYLFAADVGDNKHERDVSTIYGVHETCDVRAGNGEMMLPLKLRIEYVYPDGAHDCEGVAIDPASHDFYLITKSLVGKCGVYRLPYEQWSAEPEQPIVAERIMRLPISKVTALDFSPDGRHAIVLTYDEAYEFKRVGDEPWTKAFGRIPVRVEMPSRRQGEAVCYDVTGRQLVLTSEQHPAPVWVVELDRTGTDKVD